MCPLENQSSAKDLQQSLVQKSNEYKLAYIGTVYFKKSYKLATSRFGYLWLKIVLTKSKKKFFKRFQSQ
jgi:hypothetical protein